MTAPCYAPRHILFPARPALVGRTFGEALLAYEHDCGALQSQKLTVQMADTTDRRILDGLGVPGFDQVIILCYSDILDIQEADARTLITLLPTAWW